MKYYKSFILMILSAFTFLVSCSKDEPKEVSPVYKAGSFINTWCSTYDYGQSTVLTLANTHKVTLVESSIVEDKIVTQTIQGTWMYYPTNNVLVIQYGYQSSQGNYTTTTNSYKVKELKNGKLVLLNQETGAVTTYFRLADRYTVAIGESLADIVPHTTNILSSNPDVISTGLTEIPEVVGPGKAYVYVTNDSDYYAIEFTVLHETEVLSNFIGNSIEDVLALYGEPDLEGVVGVNPAIQYNNLTDAYKAVMVQYDFMTMEVTRILVQYTEKTYWDNDEKFISSWLNEEDGYYFPDDKMLESSFFVLCYESDGMYYISYNNTTYYIQNGHFAPKH